MRVAFCISIGSNVMVFSLYQHVNTIDGKPCGNDTKQGFSVRLDGNSLERASQPPHFSRIVIDRRLYQEITDDAKDHAARGKADLA
jgi:hypothetical protein